MKRYTYILLISLFALYACEEVIDVDLNSSSPAFFVDATITQDSVCVVRLTKTTSYFAPVDPELIEDASVSISDGDIGEALSYIGNGYYRGSAVTGTEGKTYELEIDHDGTHYRATSYMPVKASIISSNYSKSNNQNIMNPEGKTGFTIRCTFADDPLEENYYMITYTEDGEMIERRYFMLSENNNNGGSMEYIGTDTIRFSEWIFYEGGDIELKLYSIDEPVYNYFFQLDDILFWKRRYLPPVPYNPLSNFNNGALGYFAAWNIDIVAMTLE